MTVQGYRLYACMWAHTNTAHTDAYIRTHTCMHRLTHAFLLSIKRIFTFLYFRPRERRHSNDKKKKQKKGKKKEKEKSKKIIL